MKTHSKTKFGAGAASLAVLVIGFSGLALAGSSYHRGEDFQHSYVKVSLPAHAASDNCSTSPKRGHVGDNCYGPAAWPSHDHDYDRDRGHHYDHDRDAHHDRDRHHDNS